jgi:hypothetical protein
VLGKKRRKWTRHRQHFALKHLKQTVDLIEQPWQRGRITHVISGHTLADALRAD